MSNKSDRERKSQETHESLVKSLESIKTLLAQSEHKLSAARDSIARAHQRTAATDQKVAEDNFADIPVLDEIVIPGEEAANIAETLTETITAVTNSISDIPEKVADAEEMLALIDEFQTTLEKAMRDSLMKSVVTIESGLKKILKKELDSLRKQIRNKL